MFSKRETEKKQYEIAAEFCDRMRSLCISKYALTALDTPERAYWGDEMARWTILRQALREKNEQRTTK